MKHNFAIIILGGTGQVDGATVAELLAIPECREVVMVTRKPTAARPRVHNVVLDTGAAGFAERTAALAHKILSQGSVSAVSCVGVGSGSARWSEEESRRLELGVVGAFARGCHDAGIAQFGSSARSWLRYARIIEAAALRVLHDAIGPVREKDEDRLLPLFPARCDSMAFQPACAHSLSALVLAISVQ